jgi:hypothetical protein
MNQRKLQIIEVTGHTTNTPKNYYALIQRSLDFKPRATLLEVNREPYLERWN